MKTAARILFLILLAAGIYPLYRGIRRGFDTDLVSLVGGADEKLAALSKVGSSKIRVFSPDKETTDALNSIAAFETPLDLESAKALVAGEGKGLLGEKQRAMLERGETDKIRRSALRRDYGGVGLFPKEIDPWYFLNDFVLSFSEFAPKDLPEGSSILTATTPLDLKPLIDFAEKDERVALSGSPFHSYLTTERTKREINLLSLVSIIAVVGIGLALFRSVRFVLPVVSTLALGFYAASAAVFILPGRPHALVFLFGTSLIGLGVDYVYHALYERGDRKLVGSLTAALATTVLAFSPLLFSSVAVLREIAVFTIAGLAAIYSVAVLFLSGAAVVSSGTTIPAAVSADVSPAVRAVSMKWPRRIGIALALVVAAVAAIGLCRFTVSDSPAAFYRPDELMARGERRIAELSGFGEVAIRLVDLEDWQRENAALKARMGDEPKGEFLAAADLPKEMTVRIDGRDKLLLPSEHGIKVADEVAALFSRLAKETYLLFFISTAVLVFAFAVIFRRRFFAAVAPLAGSSMAAIGIGAAFGHPFNFFQALALLLVYGLGIDYVIFLMKEADAMAGRRVVFASFLTSFIGFGMLAFTSFPVTRDLGATLAVGLAAVWALACLITAGAAPSNPPEPAESLAKNDGRTNSDGSWAKGKERAAGRLRLLVFWWLYRFLGKAPVKFCTVFVVAVAYLFARDVREAVNRNRRAAGLKAGSPFRLFLNFAWSLMDKLDACTLGKNPPRFTLKGDTGWLDGGAFLLASHVGSIETLPALIDRVPGGRVSRPSGTHGTTATTGTCDTNSISQSLTPSIQSVNRSIGQSVNSPIVHAFQQLGHDKVFTSFFLERLDESKVKLHAIEDMGVGTAVELEEAIGRGESVLMAGDRLAASSGRRRRLTHAFFGRDFEWPPGVFRLAELLNAPVYAIYCVSVGVNHYEVRAKRLDDGKILPQYVEILEKMIRKYPDQWYQFHDLTSV